MRSRAAARGLEQTGQRARTAHRTTSGAPLGTPRLSFSVLDGFHNLQLDWKYNNKVFEISRIFYVYSKN